MTQLLIGARAPYKCILICNCYTIIFAGDLIVTDASTASILILANDDAFGVFSFGDPLTQEVEEGSTVFYNIIRNRGNVGSVRVYWELRVTDGSAPLTPGEDFPTNGGFTDFSPQENQQPLAITPLADRLPEIAETFQLVLTRVEVTSGGSPDGNLVSLSTSNLVATVLVLASDDPNGRMAFNAESRELTVAEDFLPENEASTRATFTVERRQGTRNDIQVLWEIFSDKVGGDLPSVLDLLFSGQWESSMTDVINKRRPGTMTPVALFSGAQDQYVTVSPEDIPTLTNKIDGFSVSAWVQPFPECDGYMIAYTTPDAATHYLSLRLTATTSASSFVLRLSSDTQ
ncbi:G-protein coupled receptor 98, partial [Plakobranchus ocellatus]